MYILIDWGNTTLKYRLLDALDSNLDEAIGGVCDSIQVLVEELKNIKSTVPIDEVLIASVRSDEEQTELLQTLRSLGWSCFLAKTSLEACGISCGYPNPKLLGIDRWLAIIAAYGSERNTAIIDMGTAITFDIVNSKGLHLGGHIVPGEALMESSLSKTGQVKVNTKITAEQIFKLGHDTTECVSFGIESLIESYLYQLIETTESEHQVTNWVFTGGNGLKWMNKMAIKDTGAIPRQIDYRSNIVFEGLIKLYQDQ